jgi:hypothetical protein
VHRRGLSNAGDDAVLVQVVQITAAALRKTHSVRWENSSWLDFTAGQAAVAPRNRHGMASGPRPIKRPLRRPRFGSNWRLDGHPDGCAHADAGLEYHQWLAKARHDRPH